MCLDESLRWQRANTALPVVDMSSLRHVLLWCSTALVVSDAFSLQRREIVLRLGPLRRLDDDVR